MPALIRDAVIDDVGRLAELHQDWWAERGREASRATLQMLWRDRIAEQDPPGRRVLVVDEPPVVGYAWVTRGRRHPDDDPEITATLLDFYVDWMVDRPGRGLARTLVERVAADLVAGGYATLQVSPELVRSNAVFERLGFQKDTRPAFDPDADVEANYRLDLG